MQEEFNQSQFEVNKAMAMGYTTSQFFRLQWYGLILKFGFLHTAAKIALTWAMMADLAQITYHFEANNKILDFYHKKSITSLIKGQNLHESYHVNQENTDSIVQILV